MIGKKVRELRKVNNLTMSELAQKSGTASSYISDLENGKIKKPSADKLLKIAKALGVAMGDLMGEETYNKKVNREIINNTPKDLLCKHYGLNEEQLESLPKEGKEEFFDVLASLGEPYKLELQYMLDNFDSITKNDLVNLCNSVKEYHIKLIDKIISDDYQPLLNRYNQILELAKFQNEEIEKYQKICSDMLSTFKSSNQ